MKIGILGSSLESIYLASYFVDLEAHVTMFGNIDPLQTYEFYKSEIDQGYWFELLKNLQGKIIFNKNRINRIQKSFLQNKEEISRMKDTFRVVTEKDEMEFYEDFDFIIEGEGLTKENSFLGGDAPALHELKYSKNKFGYYYEDEITEDILKDFKGSIALIGNFNKNKAFENLFEKETSEIHLFQQNESSFYENYEKEFQKSIEDFEAGNGSEPKRRVFQYPNFNIISLDYLEDRERLYMTLEIPDFRAQEVHFTTQSIQTIAVDKLIHFRDLKQSSSQFQSFLLENEPGYYKIEVGEWKKLNQLKVRAGRLKNEFLQYFTKI